jgi:hypothetical protein
MMKQALWNFLRAAACAVAVAATVSPQSAAAQTQSLTTGAFRNTAAIESGLVRGVTTKAAVRSLLGIPSGSGAARFASLGGDEREIWYYEDIEVTSLNGSDKGAKSSDGAMKMDMRQQILLVLFKGEVVDGYLWSSNSGTATAR